jgi:hypothetical protein
MTDLKKVAQEVNNAYETSGLVAALRELVFELQYYNSGEGEDWILDARAILEVADELEAL